MRAVRNFLCWMFALGAILFLRSTLYAVLDIASWPEAHLPSTFLKATVHTALPLLGVLYAVACWTFWMGKPSARPWGLAASAANSLLGCTFLYMDRRFLTAPATAFLNPDALLLGVGIAGLIAFRRRDAVQAEHLMQPLPGDNTNAIVNRLIWVAGTGGFLSAMTWWWRWAESNGLVWIRNSFIHDLLLLLLLEILMVAVHEFGHAAAAFAFGMRLRAFIVGPFQWRMREGHWEFRFVLAGFLAIGGATAVAPTDPSRPLWRDICMVAAGPFVSLTAGLAALALTLGAASAQGSDDPPPEPLDSAILFAPAGDLVPTALAALDRGGTLAIAGIYLTDIPSLNYAEHLFQERTVRSVTSNTREDAAEFLTLAERLHLEVTTTPYAFGQADQALADLAAGQVRGAAVLTM